MSAFPKIDMSLDEIIKTQAKKQKAKQPLKPTKQQSNVRPQPNQGKQLRQDKFNKNRPGLELTAKKNMAGAGAHKGSIFARIGNHPQPKASASNGSGSTTGKQQLRPEDIVISFVNQPKKNTQANKSAKEPTIIKPTSLEAIKLLEQKRSKQQQHNINKNVPTPATKQQLHRKSHQQPQTEYLSDDHRMRLSSPPLYRRRPRSPPSATLRDSYYDLDDPRRDSRYRGDDHPRGSGGYDSPERQHHRSGSGGSLSDRIFRQQEPSSSSASGRGDGGDGRLVQPWEAGGNRRIIHR